MKVIIDPVCDALAIQPRCAIILKHGKQIFMKKKPQIIVYVLINIFISAVTILFVMWLWNRLNPLPSQSTDNFPMTINGTGSSPETPGNTGDEDQLETTEFVTDDFEVEIMTIVGPGNLDVEYVEIRNMSQGPVNMTGWQLVDEEGQAFTFPTLILNSHGDIKILSKKGMDTVIELYWQSDIPIWESGEKARLLDTNGETIATYSIP